MFDLNHPLIKKFCEDHIVSWNPIVPRSYDLSGLEILDVEEGNNGSFWCDFKSLDFSSGARIGIRENLFIDWMVERRGKAIDCLISDF